MLEMTARNKDQGRLLLFLAINIHRMGMFQQHRKLPSIFTAAWSMKEDNSLENAKSY